MKDLHGRAAVLTGAGSGIGRALAVRLAAEGMRLVLADVESEALAETAALLPGEVYTVVTDVSDATSVDALAAVAAERVGDVHLLVNNAGVMSGAGPIWESTIADWEWLLGVNLMGIVHGIRAFVPGMLAHGQEAHIVNTSSMTGLVTFGSGGPYGASKHAAVALSELLSLELQQCQASIGVSLLCPAWVQTRILDARRNLPTDLLSTASADLPLEVRQALSADMAETGLTPEAVAEDVLEAIRSDRFYVLPNPGWTNAITDRATAIVRGTAPTPPLPS